MSGLVPIERIERQILFLRGQKVMLDKDLAELYGVKIKVFNQAVKRNKKRFPPDFMFQLTMEKGAALRSQIVTLKPGRGQQERQAHYKRSGRKGIKINDGASVTGRMSG